jgi:CBS-domain-containing membrane protein
MTASLIMESNTVVLHPTDKIGKAAKELMAHRFRSLPVVDDNNRYVGQLTVNGMLYLVLPKVATMADGLNSVPYVNISLKDLHQRLMEVIDEPVTLCMEEDIKIVHPDTPLIETLLTLYHSKTSLPVVDKHTGRLTGMISYFDVGAKIMSEDV